MDDPEAVGDEAVGETGQLVGERAAQVVVLAGLAGVEADVLEQGDVAVTEARDRLGRRRADGVVGERDRRAEQLTEPLGHRRERVAVLRARPWDGRGGPPRRRGRPPPTTRGWWARWPAPARRR